MLAVPKPLAAPRQGLTFSPVIIVAAPADGPDRRVRRVHGCPAGALREAADARAHEPSPGGDRRRRGHHDLPAARDDDPRRDGHRHRRGPGAAVPRLRGRHGPLGCRRGPAPRTQPVRHRRPGPGDRQDLRECRAGVHHGAVPGHRGTHADGRVAGGGRAVRERGDTGAGDHVQRRRASPSRPSRRAMPTERPSRRQRHRHRLRRARRHRPAPRPRSCPPDPPSDRST